VNHAADTFAEPHAFRLDRFVRSDETFDTELAQKVIAFGVG
jgi:cytochrome P450